MFRILRVLCCTLLVVCLSFIPALCSAEQLVGRYDDVKDRYDKIVAAITDKEAKSVRLENFINELKDRDGIIQDFDNRLWGSLVDFVTVGKEKEITVTFRDGTEIMV